MKEAPGLPSALDEFSVELDSTGDSCAHAVSSESGRPPSFVYLDCGAWLGDGRNAPLQRNFGVVCGRVVALCEFRPGGPLRELVDGPGGDIALLNAMLRALAGPQRMDVVVRGQLLAPPPLEGDVAPPIVRLFLPDMHLPLVTPMPDVDPNLVPDPNQATCWCHGPIFARIDGTAPQAGYRAVGTFLSRNPNDWFYLLANTYRSAAEDLVRFLDRLGRVGASLPFSIVQLGGLFDVWAGFRCAFAATGRAAILEPRIVAGVAETELREQWSALTLETPVKNAVNRLLRLPDGRRTLLAAAHVHRGPDPTKREPPTGTGLVRTRTRSFVAENRPEPVTHCDDRPPHAVLGLREQQARFVPWVRNLEAGWREELVAGAARLWVREPFGVYVMAHTHAPCLSRVTVAKP